MRTVCFFGDSITRRGYWIAELFEHLRKDGVRIFNCGVSGDSATAALSRLYTDCLHRSPDVVVMMFGMNDIGRDLYNEGKTDVEEKKQQRIDRYKTSVRALADQILATGTDLILCTPTPCDDVTPDAPVINHSNDGLELCAAYIRELAKELSVPCVDFLAYLRPLLGKEYQTLPDRVHPTPESHHFMAQCFMRDMEWIREIDPTPFLPLSAENQARFDVEQKAREIEFIEWNLMYGERKKRKMTHADFIALAEERLSAAKETGDARQIGWYQNYLNIVENKQEYEGELVRRTLEMASPKQ